LEGLITNFHLPARLLMLVSALIGQQRLLALYRKRSSAIAFIPSAINYPKPEKIK